MSGKFFWKCGVFLLEKCRNFFKTMLLTLVTFFTTSTVTNAAADEGKILFIPHDNRPISYQQTVEVIEQLGYEIVAPPKNLLSVAAPAEQPDELWQWLFENVKGAKCAIISSDSLLYGGLIPSRKHEVTIEILDKRLENFSKLKNDNPNLKIYVFDSLMRTPQRGTKGDIEEPAYYVDYGANFFDYSMLDDKKELHGLTQSEEKLMAELKSKIPSAYYYDWFMRRNKNLNATKKMIQLTAENVISYLIIGRDDNAPLSQTHKEHREIISCAKEFGLSEKNFQCMPGIDEFNLLLLTRAVNEMLGKVPKVNVQYNDGKGGDTVPHFSDEKISASIDASINIARAEKVSSPKKADFVLLVNTDIGGETFWGHNPFPDGKSILPSTTPSESTKNFIKIVEKNLKKNFPVGIADINFANGSDNALMKFLQDRNLLFKLQSYAGWNTATNSTGFALATGILAKNMSATSKQRLLMRRYLDDWAYQANVRTFVANEIFNQFGDPAIYYNFIDKRAWAEDLNTKLMKDFAKKNLPHLDFLKDFKVENPWNRMFECEITFSE